MPASLTSEQVAQYHRDGFFCPVPALTAEEVARFRTRLEAFEAGQGTTLCKLPDLVKSKTHLLFTWMHELVTHPKVLDAVESIIGPDILLYHLTSWFKEPGETSFVSWHQDGTYFDLEPFEQVTCWIALSDSTREMGCVKVIPGTHVIGQRPHQDMFQKGNLLSRGQTLTETFDDSNAAFMELKAGQVSLHHTHVVHCSGNNTTGERRLGIGVSYIPTRCRTSPDARLTATLVRGEDRYGNFDLETPPARDFDETARAHHAACVDRFFTNNIKISKMRHVGGV